MKVFFDLDGTLLDVAPRHYRVYTELVAEYSGAPLDQPKYWDLKRKKTKWPELLRASQLSPEILDQFLEQFIAKIEAPEYLKIDQLFPDALRVLDAVSRHHPCYLVSLRRHRKPLLEQVAWLNLAPHFEEVLTGHSEADGSDVKIPLIKSRLQGDSGVIIGDTEADILAGKELGLTTVAVSSGIRDEQFLAALEPDYLLPGIADPRLLALVLHIHHQ